MLLPFHLPWLLFRDLSILPNGSSTMLGERGTTLSGGQQQRLSIARALYGQPKLLVADDPIAAVDAVVGGQIFDNLRAYVDGDPTLGSGKEKRAAIVSLNQLHLLSRCDSVLFLEDGKAIAQGTYQELLGGCSLFKEYVSSYSAQNNGTADGPEGAEICVSTVAGAGSDLTIAPEAPQVRHRDASSSTESTTVKSMKADQLIKKEVITTGVVRSDILLQYIAKGGNSLFVGVLASLVMSFMLLGANDLWLAYWTSGVENGDIQGASWYHCGIYCLLSFLYISVNLASCLIFIEHQAWASTGIHNECLRTVLASPLSWFESVPSGRILSRFGGDLYILDIQFGVRAVIFSSLISLSLISLLQMTMFLSSLPPVRALVYGRRLHADDHVWRVGACHHFLHRRQASCTMRRVRIFLLQVWSYHLH